MSDFYEQLTDEQRKAIEEFVKRVNAGADLTISKTGAVEGAHWNSMQRELSKMRFPQGVMVFGWVVSNE